MDEGIDSCAPVWCIRRAYFDVAGVRRWPLVLDSVSPLGPQWGSGVATLAQW